MIMGNMRRMKERRVIVMMKIDLCAHIIFYKSLLSIYLYRIKMTEDQ